MLGIIGEKIRGIDTFGTPIVLSYNGRTKYKTICGGVLSTVLTLLVLFYIYLLVTTPLTLSTEKVDGKNNTLIGE